MRKIFAVALALSLSLAAVGKMNRRPPAMTSPVFRSRPDSRTIASRLALL